MFEDSRVASLILGFIKDELSESEQQELNLWLNFSDANRKYFETRITKESIIEGIDVLSRINETRASEKLLALRTSEYKAKSISPIWKYLAAAAITGVLFSAVGYLYLKNGGNIHKINSQPQVALGNKNDLFPGGNKAILTLGNGVKITLDSTSNQAIAKQGSTSIHKVKNGLLAYTALTEKPSEVLLNVLTTPRGGEYQLRLPDGTNVWLNAASSITYPTAFTGKTREVILTGEAYFEVAKNKAMPFHVKFKDMEVTVLGTHFNIMAYGDESVSRTTLLEGSVRINKGNQTALLSPGQQANVGNDIHVIKQVNIEEATAWRNHLFDFHSTDIKTVMRTLGRWYDVDVKYEGVISSQKLTGLVSRDSKASEVLHILSTSGYHFRIDGKSITVIP